MSELTTHIKANREFFAKGAGPKKAQWCEWIEAGVVRGKIIAGQPFVDANHFAANDVLEAPEVDGDDWVELLS